MIRDNLQFDIVLFFNGTVALINDIVHDIAGFLTLGHDIDKTVILVIEQDVDNMSAVVGCRKLLQCSRCFRYRFGCGSRINSCGCIGSLCGASAIIDSGTSVCIKNGFIVAIPIIISTAPPINEKTAELCMYRSTSFSSRALILSAPHMPVRADIHEKMLIKKESIVDAALIAPIASEPFGEY